MNVRQVSGDWVGSSLATFITIPTHIEESATSQSLMPFIDYGQRRLTRPVCVLAAPPALGDAGDVLHKHRCLLGHSSAPLNPVFAYPPSSISRLSNEELLLIFEEAVYGMFDHPVRFARSGKPSILVTISHVCRRWRGIALSNSCLWGHILAFLLSDVGRHLFRSATCPLNIYGVFPTQKVTAGSLPTGGNSVAIADALVESAPRWQALHWYDASANGTTSVLGLTKTLNAYPMLETLEIMLPESAYLGTTDPAKAEDAVLFPALKNIVLTCVHPMALPHNPMPSLESLKLEGLSCRLLFSKLFSLLHRSPALRSLVLHHTFPMIDLLEISLNPRPPRLFRNGPLRGTRFRLPHLTHLSLHPAPALGLPLLFALLDLPALACLDLHVHTDPRTAHWPFMAPDGRIAAVRPSDPGPDAWVVPLPTLRTLRVTYCISLSLFSPHHAPPEPQPPRLWCIAFPALTDLQITHVFVRDPGARNGNIGAPLRVPPPRPLRPFDALFHTPSFTHVARLTLAECALPFSALCEALQTRFPALKVLVLSACPGAGPVMCALAPGECEGGCEKRGAWIGLKVRGVVVSRREEVQVGCLRKVIEARIRA